MIEGRVPPVEDVSEHVSLGGAPWYDDRCVGWMLEAEPISGEVGPLVLSEISEVEHLSRCVTIGCGLAGRCNLVGTAEYPCPLAPRARVTDLEATVERYVVDAAASVRRLEQLEQEIILRDRAITALTTRVSKILAERDDTAELCLEASCRLEERRQLMESACTALSVELDTAYQVTAALVAERDMLGGMLCANAGHEGKLACEHPKLTLSFELQRQRLAALVAGFRAVTLTFEDIVQAGILYDQEWLVVAREAVAAARRLVGVW